jgi:hypothetical protein
MRPYSASELAAQEHAGLPPGKGGREPPFRLQAVQAVLPTYLPGSLPSISSHAAASPAVHRWTAPAISLLYSFS